MVGLFHSPSYSLLCIIDLFDIIFLYVHELFIYEYFMSSFIKKVKVWAYFHTLAFLVFSFAKKKPNFALFSSS